MTCPKCRSTNVLTQVFDLGERYYDLGCAVKLFRWLLIIITLGAWRWIKREPGFTKRIIETRAACQHCGFQWKVD